ncbi:DUF2487 family protein [Saliterribacillus persicus]|uniref:Uncharacterized protein DUF2487 n=1 Tax=Saliterribacillus persicus TaxID=930114 RepID=A0A368XAD6_9BACI|nr:DUF2487 family protein [Saliterribacillus persicus]RCW64923.1 uncharacterized protein DUF2487 [Saliterribacillus persicus]
MEWKQKDRERYQEAKEYVDTIFIPLLGIDDIASNQAQDWLEQADAIQVISKEIERHYTGRVFLYPTYTYHVKCDYQLEVNRLNNWIENLKNEHFKHVFFLSFDPQWKLNEKDLNGQLLWITAPSINEREKEDALKVLHHQAKLLSDLIRTYWKNS